MTLLLAAATGVTSRFDDPLVAFIVGGVLVLLVAATTVGEVVQVRAADATLLAKVRAMNLRIRGWWLIFAVVAISVLAGATTAIVLFAVVSFAALREFVTLAPTSRADHGSLAWAFFIVLPVQYVLIALDEPQLSALFIPVWCFLFLALRAALAGDTDHFLERTAIVQWGIMACVYCVSHAPGLLLLDLDGFTHEPVVLLLWFIVVVELCDAFQNLFGTYLGRHPMGVATSPNKTWEGVLGGITAGTIAGAAMYQATPFDPVAAAVFGFGVSLLGVAGRIVMSAVKRGRGVRVYGVLIEGHGGVLDRVDSLLFAAPLFYYAVSSLYT